jgi:G3E family GTPase
VLGGFLGSGKTTLLNHLLAGTQGRRTAVLVNDFGELGIDAQLISSQSPDVIQLANGCVCCSLAEGLSTALARVLALRKRPDCIVVEASGVSLPWKIAQIGVVDPELVVDGIVVVVDAGRIRALASDRYVGDVVLAQLARSDLLVLNKIDLVPAYERQSLRTWLSAAAPGTPIVEATFGNVPLPLLTNYDSDLASVWCSPEADSANNNEGHHHFATTTFASETPFHRGRLSAALSRLPPGIFRLKGFVLLGDSPEHRYLLQAVGQRSSITPYSDWPSGRRETTLIAVCDDECNAQAVRRTLTDCLRNDTTAP